MLVLLEHQHTLPKPAIERTKKKTNKKRPEGQLIIGQSQMAARNKDYII